MEITDYKFESFKITFYEKDTTDYALIVKPPYEEYHPYQSYVKLTLVYSDKTEKHIKFYDYGENAEIKRYRINHLNSKVIYCKLDTLGNYQFRNF